jgi:hypothetical protein
MSDTSKTIQSEVPPDEHSCPISCVASTTYSYMHHGFDSITVKHNWCRSSETGKLEGTQMSWYVRTGKLCCVSNYKDSKLCGEYKKWNYDGVLVYHAIFDKDNHKAGPNIIYYDGYSSI